MKRKVVSILLVAALAGTMLAGCGSSGEGTSSDTGSAAAETSDGESGDEYSAEIDMDEEPYTVAIQMVTMPGTDYSETIEQIEAAVNEITLPEINCEVDIQPVWISELANTTSMGVAGDEKIDLIAVGTVQPLSSMVGSEMLLDMNEGNLLQNRGATLVELFGDTLEAGEVNGKQLAVQAQVYTAAGRGIYYNKTIADAAGVTIGETITMDELEEALIAIHEYDGSIYPYYVGQGTSNLMFWLESYDTFGTESSYGVILDASSDTTVVNMYASDAFADYCVRMQKWNELGLLPGDPTDTTAVQDYFGSGQAFCAVVSMNPTMLAGYSQYDFETGEAALVEPKITGSDVTEFMWGIAANCERPDKAMDLLNFLYENEEAANLMKYGIEGVSYEFAEGSDSVIVTNDTFNSGFFKVGNTREMLIESPLEEDAIEKLEELENSAEISPVLGYMFDDTDFQTESAMIDSAISQYLPQLQNGMAGSEEATLELVDEFVNALEAAGINDVIAANQEQLDAWLAEQ